VIDRSIPLGWSAGRRFENSYVENNGQALLFIDGDTFNVRLLKEVTDPDENIQAFKVVKEDNFKSFDEAWQYARRLMINETSINRMKQRYSRKKKSTKPKTKRKVCRCKK
jgi:hypothetical protein